ncbi:MAG: tetratricopeptide repeat protein [Ktedonobacteraceae bacterium]
MSGEEQAARFFEQVQDIAIARRLRHAQKQARNYELLEQDINLLWDAVGQCYRRKDWERLVAFREALQFFLDLRGFWGHSLILNKWVDEASRARGDAFNRARWIHDRADILNQQGHYQEAEQLYQRSEDLYRSLDQDEWALKSRHMRSMVLRAQGKTAEAQRLCQATIDEARKLGLEQWLAHPLYVLALFMRDQGDIQEAEAVMGESLTRLAGTNEEAMIAQCHNFLGELALRQKKFAQTREHLESALQLIQRVGIKRLEMTTRRLLGDLAVAEGRYEDAEQIYSESMRIFDAEQLDDRPGQAQMLFSRGRLMAQLQRLPEAAEMLETSLDLYKKVGNARRVVGVSLLLAKVCMQRRHRQQALALTWQALRTACAAAMLRPRLLRSLWRLQSM